MPMHEEPVVGAFYEDDEDRTFEVVSFDENDGTIEVRYADSTSDEIDLDDWYGMDLERLESEEEEEEEEAEKPSGVPVPDDEDDDLEEDDDDLSDDEKE